MAGSCVPSPPIRGMQGWPLPLRLEARPAPLQSTLVRPLPWSPVSGGGAGAEEGSPGGGCSSGAVPEEGQQQRRAGRAGQGLGGRRAQLLLHMPRPAPFPQPELPAGLMCQPPSCGQAPPFQLPCSWPGGKAEIAGSCFGAGMSCTSPCWSPPGPAGSPISGQGRSEPRRPRSRPAVLSQAHPPLSLPRDYETVRRGGLIFAVVAFMLGLLVILSEYRPSPGQWRLGQGACLPAGPALSLLWIRQLAQRQCLKGGEGFSCFRLSSRTPLLAAWTFPARTTCHPPGCQAQKGSRRGARGCGLGNSTWEGGREGCGRGAQVGMACGGGALQSAESHSPPL